MKFLRSIFFFLSAFQFAAANDDLVLGLQGLQQAAKDPKVLAQLMQDLNDPEMMAEAKKMMDNPEWKESMKKMAESGQFKDALKQTEKMLKDPDTNARLHAQMEAMLNVGQKQLQDSAEKDLDDAINAMLQPGMMEQTHEMLKDPEFVKSLQDAFKEDSFKRYWDLMGNKLGSEETKEKFAALKKKYESVSDGN